MPDKSSHCDRKFISLKNQNIHPAVWQFSKFSAILSSFAKLPILNKNTVSARIKQTFLRKLQTSGVFQGWNFDGVWQLLSLAIGVRKLTLLALAIRFQGLRIEVAKEIRKKYFLNLYSIVSNKKQIKHQQQQELKSNAWYYYPTWYYIQIETSPFLGETLRFRSMLGIFIVTLHTTIFQWDSIATAGMINKYAFQCLRTDGRGRRIEASRCHLWLLDIIVFRWDAIYFKVRLPFFFYPKLIWRTFLYF